MPVPPFPARDLIIDTSHYDGTTWVVPMCSWCRHYAYNISDKTVTGVLGTAVHTITLAELNKLAAEHKCPDQVVHAATELWPPVK